MVISGRGEFHNKGIDLFLEALGRLNAEMGPDQTVLAFLFVLSGYTDLIPSLKSDAVRPDPANPPIATHRLQNEAFDPILQTCERLGLKNLPQNRVQVIFVPAYLNGHDGLINMPYYEALAGCDLGVFPSYYEPWGYTPLESAAYAVPTVTTDQAGFGLWAQQVAGDCNGIILLKRLGQPDDGDRGQPPRHLPEFSRPERRTICSACGPTPAPWPAGQTGRISSGTTRRPTTAPSRPPGPARRSSPRRTSRPS